MIGVNLFDGWIRVDILPGASTSCNAYTTPQIYQALEPQVFEAQLSYLKSILWTMNDVVGYNETQPLSFVVIIDLLEIYARFDNLPQASTRM